MSLNPSKEPIDRIPEIVDLESEFSRAPNGQKFPAGLKLAQCLAEHGAFDRAISVLEQIRTLPLNEDQSLITLQMLGQAHLRLTQYQEAYLYLGEALTRLSARPYSPELFQVYYDLAWMFFRQGYLDNSRTYIDGARLVLEELKIPSIDKQKVEILHISALVEAAAGNLETAAELLLQEIEHYSNDQEQHLAAAYNKLASIQYTMGHIGQALEYQGLTHSLAFKRGDHFRLALSHKNYGDIYYIMGDFTGALGHYRESEDLCRMIDNGLGQVFVREAMARIKARQNEYEEAKALLDQALEMARNLRNRDREAGILVDLAEWYCLLNQPEAALGCLKLSEGIDHDRGQASSPRHQVIKAWALLQSEVPSRAVEALSILESITSKPLRIDDEEMTAIPELEAEANYLLSLSCQSQGKKDSAAKALDRAKNLLRKLCSTIPVEHHQNFWNKPNVAKIMTAG